MTGYEVEKRRHGFSVAVTMIAVLFATEAVRAQPAPSGQTRLLTIAWKTLHEQDQLTSGTFVAADGKEPDRLQLVHEAKEPRLFALHEFVPPSMSQPSYVVRGKVKYAGVQGQGYLELWNHFANQEAYFTRTMANGGPLGKIAGTSGWREFSLPFRKGDKTGPEKLVLNLALEGPGTVEISDLELHSPAPEQSTMTAAGAWWSDRMGGLVGGLGGSFLGVFLGGCLGPLIGMGKARRFVMASFLVVGVLCAGLLLAGLIAVISGQPYGVYYPLLLLGGLGGFFCVMGLRTAGPKYDAVELRRMTALDAAR
ncbi:MAG: hypothetical protein SH850_19785 [Planctomycetaceae bacterium]|nr:hypothetical protein [Planctomycetaceae bacterium]